MVGSWAVMLIISDVCRTVPLVVWSLIIPVTPQKLSHRRQNGISGLQHLSKFSCCREGNTSKYRRSTSLSFFRIYLVYVSVTSLELVYKELWLFYHSPKSSLNIFTSWIGLHFTKSKSLPVVELNMLLFILQLVVNFTQFDMFNFFLLNIPPQLFEWVRYNLLLCQLCKCTFSLLTI